ncbi:PREDICTED: uncharacterized protein LOC109468279 [Branchiostoma belcheri]|uniref:Uncharacterized protein LOC109468279 n=1 Tax=Branchiostoma belcheri TaxID=7741 RepID=A0A6P4YK16_BRABE|nr:PREDICTED: uncharacterized protein LOC109468279 [Branchiostoma belcheri]
MTGSRFSREYPNVSRIIGKNENLKYAKPGFKRSSEQSFYIFPNQLCTVRLSGNMGQNGPLKLLESLYLFTITKINACKKAVYNIRFPETELVQHVKEHAVVDFFERKRKDSGILVKQCNSSKALTSGSNASPSFLFGKRRETFDVYLRFLFGIVVPKPLSAFETPPNYRDTKYQVVEPYIVSQVLERIFELVLTFEDPVQTSIHYKIATLILIAWNNRCIPKEGVRLEYFLSFFIRSLGIYVNACIKEAKENSQVDSKPIDVETDKPVDQEQVQAGARVPAMTKAGLKEHMASLRQMWCQEFSAGLAEDLLCEDRQRALRRFGREKGLKQYEIDNILNASSASLKEKGLALMDAWQHGRCGSIVRSGKELQQEHFEETLKALSRRGRNSHKDRESKAPSPPDGGL